MFIGLERVPLFHSDRPCFNICAPKGRPVILCLKKGVVIQAE